MTCLCSLCEASLTYKATMEHYLKMTLGPAEDAMYYGVIALLCEGCKDRKQEASEAFFARAALWGSTERAYFDEGEIDDAE